MMWVLLGSIGITAAVLVAGGGIAYTVYTINFINHEDAAEEE